MGVFERNDRLLYHGKKKYKKTSPFVKAKRAVARVLKTPAALHKQDKGGFQMNLTSEVEGMVCVAKGPRNGPGAHSGGRKMGSGQRD